MSQRIECDRCVARALFVSTTANGLKLYWCGHHGRLYESTNPVTIKQTAPSPPEAILTQSQWDTAAGSP